MSDPSYTLAKWAGRSAKETRIFLEDNNLELDYYMVNAAGCEGKQIWTHAAQRMSPCCCGVLISVPYDRKPCETCGLQERCYTCATTGAQCDADDYFWREEEKHFLVALAWAKQHAKTCDDPLVSRILKTFAREEGHPRYQENPFGLLSLDELKKALAQVSEYMKAANLSTCYIRTIREGLSDSFIGHHGWTRDMSLNINK